MFKWIFFGAFIFFALISMLIGMLKGKKFKWQVSTARIAIVIVSAILAMVLGAVVSYLVAMLIFGAFGGLISSNETVAALFGTVETIPAIIKAVVAMLLAPIFFTVFFFVSRGVLYRFDGTFIRLVAKMVAKDKKNKDVTDSAPEVEAVVEAEAESDIVAEISSVDDGEGEFSEYEAEASTPIKMTRKEKKKNRNKEFRSDKFDPIGAVCGAVCGFLVYVVILMPIFGGVGPINTVLQLAMGRSDDKVSVIVCDISDAAANNAGAKTVKVLGGDLVYSGLTTYPINGKLASVNREFKLVAAVENAVTVSSDKKVDRAEAADEVRNISKQLKKAKMLPMLVSEFMSESSDKWSEGEAFCGIAAPGADGKFGDLLTDVYDVMKGSTYDTVSDDLGTIVESVALFVENDAFADIKGNNVLGVFKNEELVSGVILALLENERLSPLVGSITNMGVSLMTDMLEVEANDEELYKGFIEDMTEEYNYALDHGSSVSELSGCVGKVYDRYGIQMSSGASTCVAAAMMEKLDRCDTDDMAEFFGGEPFTSESLAATAPVMIASSSNNRSDAFAMLDRIVDHATVQTTEEELKEVIKTEFANVCSNMSEEEFETFSADLAKSILKDVNKDGFKYENAAVIDKNDVAQTSVVVTSDELKIVYTDVEDKQAEADAIASIFASALSVVDEISAGNKDIDNIIIKFGPTLDSFAESKLLGREYTARFLTAMLQSNSVRSNVGFTLIQATDVAESINGGAGKGESYTVLMKTLGNTVTVMKTSSDNGDATEAINELMKDITPTSAETLQKLSTPDTVKNYGVKERSAEPVSEMLSDIFGNMSVAKENGMPEEQYEKESVAVNDMLNIAMSATKSTEKTTFGENSATGISATEFVDRTIDSVIISDTLVNTVYGEAEEAKKDPLNSQKQLTEAEKTELVGALDAKWKAQLSSSDDAAANAEYEKLLTSIASIVNVQVSISGDNVVVA